ncbi:hypothetical protein ACFU44_13745 [Nocardia rhizosphaerihabitans]|uniref:hypothetical protein n=1 Tax=Nocardia rhizosphaerihabitans TaxID=1691570 RepID=UPI0036700A5B
MARALQQVMAELDPYYSSSRSIVRQQLDAAPAQEQAEISGLDAKLGQANENILSGARNRGLGFSGIPVGEQAKYAATDYAPAIANLKGKYVGQKNTLLEVLNSLDRDQRTQAQGIFDNEGARELQLQQLAENQRQFNENLAFQKGEANRAAAKGSGGISLGGGLPTGSRGATPGAAKISRTSDGGFNFFDAAGRPINAAQYSQVTGVEYRQLLSQMAQAGDKNAQAALKYVGNDYKFGTAPSQLKGVMSALGATGSYGVSTGKGGSW